MSSSPIKKIFDWVAASPFRIAPEGREELLEEVTKADIVLVCVEDDPTGSTPKVLAEYDIDKKEVRLGDGFMEALWATCHLYLVAYRSYCEAQAAGHSTFDLSADAKNVAAFELFKDRLQSLGAHRPTPWPAGVVRPMRYPYEFSDAHATNELFLVAVGWIIHHELAHARLEHEEESLRSMEQEHEADTEATKRACASPASETELLKRSMGISAAVLLLMARDIAGRRRFFKTHPPTYERLLNVLSQTGTDDNSVVYGSTFVILDILLTAAGKSDTLDRDKATLSDLCFEACLVLRGEAVIGAY